MSPPIFAQRQMANLWGRSVGQLNQKIVDIDWTLDRENFPPTVDFKILETSNTEEIPDDAEIWLNIRYRLRMHRYYCGTKGDPHLPKDGDDGGNKVTAFGDKYGEAKWDMKFVDPRESGRVWAWTEPTRLVPGESVLRDDYGKSLLSIRMAAEGVLDSEAWDMDFEDTTPAILINPLISEMKEELKSKNPTSLLVMPEVLAHILDQIIKDHCEISIQAGTSRWQEEWLTWANNRTDSRLPHSVESPDDMISCLQWKSDVIQELKETINQASKIRESIDGGDE